MKLEEIKKKALEQNIPIIMDDTLKIIEEILLKNNPKRILEIGTAVGYSAICFATILNNSVIIDTIERDEVRSKEAIKNIKSMNLENAINVISGDAIDILPTLNSKYDIVFIDAAKGKYPFFLEQAIRLLAKNGIIIADNILYKGYTLSDYNKHKQRTAVRGLREYLNLLQNDERFETQLINVGDGLTISKLKEF